MGALRQSVIAYADGALGIVGQAHAAALESTTCDSWFFGDEAACNTVIKNIDRLVPLIGEARVEAGSLDDTTEEGLDRARSLLAKLDAYREELEYAASGVYGATSWRDRWIEFSNACNRDLEAAVRDIVRVGADATGGAAWALLKGVVEGLGGWTVVIIAGVGIYLVATGKVKVPR